MEGVDKSYYCFGVAVGEETIFCSNVLMSVLGQGTTLALFGSEVVVFFFKLPSGKVTHPFSFIILKILETRES